MEPHSPLTPTSGLPCSAEPPASLKLTLMLVSVVEVVLDAVDEVEVEEAEVLDEVEVSVAVVLLEVLYSDEKSWYWIKWKSVWRWCCWMYWIVSKSAWRCCCWMYWMGLLSPLGVVKRVSSYDGRHVADKATGSRSSLEARHPCEALQNSCYGRRGTKQGITQGFLPYTKHWHNVLNIGRSLALLFHWLER